MSIKPPVAFHQRVYGGHVYAVTIDISPFADGIQAKGFSASQIVALTLQLGSFIAQGFHREYLVHANMKDKGYRSPGIFDAENLIICPMSPNIYSPTRVTARISSKRLYTHDKITNALEALVQSAAEVFDSSSSIAFPFDQSSNVSSLIQTRRTLAGLEVYLA
ncbi:MAG: hypothetical protein AABX51_05475 [Nanoarchaeota archaeon]